MPSIQDTNKVVLLLSLLSSHLLCICTLPQPESIIVDSEVVERNGYKRDMESFGGRGFELFSSGGLLLRTSQSCPMLFVAGIPSCLDLLIYRWLVECSARLVYPGVYCILYILAVQSFSLLLHTLSNASQ